MPQPDLSALWDEHTKHEFTTRDTEATLATMVEDAYVNHVPVMTGGYGEKCPARFLLAGFHPQHAARHDADPRFTHRRRGPVGGRDDLLVHAYARDSLDAARRTSNQ